MEKNIIRISCSAISRIVIDNKYLLIKSNKSNMYIPIGGALKYFNPSFLGSVEFEPERTDNDLRIFIDKKHLQRFRSWFNMFKDRETDVYREVIEELQPLLSTNISDLKETYLFTNEMIDSNYRIFQTHHVELSDLAKKEILELIDSGTTELILATSDEISNQLKNISNHSKYIL